MWYIALVYKNRKLVSWGINHTKTNPILKKFPYKNYSDTTHAEFSADKKIRKMDKSKLNMIVIRINRIGNFNNSMPCLGCQQYLKSQGYKKVKFINEKGELCQINLQSII